METHRTRQHSGQGEGVGETSRWTSGIVAFIPARNEEDRISACVSGVLTIPGVRKVVVIDDASSDKTRIRALAAGATVKSLLRQSGKGAALMAGIEDECFDYCLFIDADVGSTAEQGALLLAPVVSGDLDMAIARLPQPTSKVGFGKVKSLAARAIEGVDSGFECQAPLSGQRAMTRACLESALPLAQGYGVEVALSVRALRAGYRLGEIETTMSHRQTSNSPAGFAHRARQYLDVKRAIVSLELQRR